MIRLCKNRGFSLTEVLLSVGILSVGMIFIAGVFPVAIHFTTIATERTIAAIAADEAFAKIKLYAMGDMDDPSDDIKLGELRTDALKPDESTEFDEIFPAAEDIDPNEFVYPSTGTSGSAKQYCWSALCRLAENNPNPPVQVTVFISRKVSPGLRYPKDNLNVPEYDWPRPAIVGVEDTVAENILRIRSRPGASGDKRFINDGYTIVDNATGRIYRVLERYRDDPDTAESEDEKILLDRNWDVSSPGGPPDAVWVVPPPVGGGRYPCIAVYQKVIKF